MKKEYKKHRRFYKRCYDTALWVSGFNQNLGDQLSNYWQRVEVLMNDMFNLHNNTFLEYVAEMAVKEAYEGGEWGEPHFPGYEEGEI